MVVSKGGLMVTGAVWTIESYTWAIAASMWAVTSSMSDAVASVCDVQVMCGLLDPQCRLH